MAAAVITMPPQEPVGKDAAVEVATKSTLQIPWQVALISGSRMRQKGVEMSLYQTVQGCVFGRARTVHRAIAVAARSRDRVVRRAHDRPLLSAPGSTLA